MGDDALKEERIVNRIRDGDEEAIDAVMRRYTKLLWSVAAGILRGVASPQDTEECVADAFIKLWQEPEKFDPARGNLKQWLCMVVRSRALDRYREIQRREEQPINEDILSRSLNLEDGLFLEENKGRLMKALALLPEQDRDIVLRRYVREQKPREIAAALGLPVKQVKNRLYRTKEKLRSLMIHETEE